MAAKFLHWADRVAMIHDLRWRKFPVTSDGFVCLADVMGDDRSVVQAARTSYGRDVREPLFRHEIEGMDAEKLTKQDKADRALIRRLRRDMHTTPFEMCELKFLVRVPMDCWRQWIRHRTASVNEYSTRYSEAIDSRQTTKPEEWRLQSGTNKQGSSGLLKDQPKCQSTEGCNTMSGLQKAEMLSYAEFRLHKSAQSLYEDRLKLGVAREQARKDLPLSTYTEAYWKIDLHNLFHFLSLRLDSHAQLEIRQYAEAIYGIVKQLFPVCVEAFDDYDFRRGGMLLSAADVQAIRAAMALTVIDDGSGSGESPFSAYFESENEKNEFLKKIARLGFSD